MMFEMMAGVAVPGVVQMKSPTLNWWSVTDWVGPTDQFTCSRSIQYGNATWHTHHTHNADVHVQLAYARPNVVRRRNGMWNDSNPARNDNGCNHLCDNGGTRSLWRQSLQSLGCVTCACKWQHHVCARARLRTNHKRGIGCMSNGVRSDGVRRSLIKSVMGRRMGECKGTVMCMWYVWT